jgi:succinate dehydrogenase / fumarate reductase flavoprotein subunit
MMLNANIPSGPIEQAWDKGRFDMKLVSPANKRGHSLIVVGSGLAGTSASASLGELGYNVKCFCFQDSPRRAHSILGVGGQIVDIPVSSARENDRVGNVYAEFA